jgi:hypothetical protein
MSVIGKMTKKRSEIPMKMVTKVKQSKKDYSRKRAKAELKRETKKYA